MIFITYKLLGTESPFVFSWKEDRGKKTDIAGNWFCVLEENLQVSPRKSSSGWKSCGINFSGPPCYTFSNRNKKEEW